MAAPTTIARYEILNRIGRGGMGALYLARDPKIDRLVAIKVLHADLEGDDMRIRFDREARSAGAMNHPNIVTIFDYGVFEDSPYIVMEYLRGETLAEVIKRKAPMPLRDKLNLLEQLCRGLAYAHEAGIIHRDIKPANLMIDQHGVLKILDFGIARLAESGLTQMSMTIGTPGYMSPEQIDGRHVERSSDVFAVGAVAYELLTYKAAFGGDSQNAIIYNVLHSTPEPILSLAPDVGAGVAAIVNKALEKATTARYEDAASLQADFQAAREALGRTVRVPRNTPVSRPVTPVPNLAETPTRLARSMPDVLPDPGKSYLDSARIAHAAGELSRALDLVDRMLESEPANPEALALQQQIEDAKVDELLGKARAGLLGQRLTEAGDLVGRALKIRPKSEAALKMQADLDSRRTIAEKKSGGRARARAAVERGRKYIKDGAWDAARRAADEAWALDPENPDAVELIAAAEAGQSGGGAPASYPGMELLRSTTEPMQGNVSTTAVQISVPMSAMAVPATAPMAGPSPSAVTHTSRRGTWMLLAGVGSVAIAVAAVMLLNQPAKPVAPPPVVDTTKPVAVLVSPSAGEPVKGTVKIKVNANDDVAVASVTINLDGALLKEFKDPPYEVVWNSATVGDGQHTITVDAADAAGNHSAPVSATFGINNTPTTAPTNTSGNTPPPVTSSKPQVPRPEPFPGGTAATPVKLTAAQQQQLDNLLTQADDFIGKGKYAEALALIEKALDINKLDAKALGLQTDANKGLVAEKKKGRGGGGL